MSICRRAVTPAGRERRRDKGKAYLLKRGVVFWRRRRRPGGGPTRAAPGACLYHAPGSPFNGELPSIATTARCDAGPGSGRRRRTGRSKRRGESQEGPTRPGPLRPARVLVVSEHRDADEEEAEQADDQQDDLGNFPPALPGET